MQAASTAVQQQNTSSVPAIGTEWQGGIYAGITLHEDKAAHLILLPGDVSKTWSKAKEWAAEQEGELPSRIDSLVLFKNVNSEFKRDWYWTSEQHASGSDSAWIQLFSNGSQTYHFTASKFRARAVRRLPI